MAGIKLAIFGLKHEYFNIMNVKINCRVVDYVEVGHFDVFCRVIIQLTDEFRKMITLYLLVEIFWCEEEVVEWHKVSLQQPHQQHQIHTVCKLKQQTNIPTVCCH